MRPKKVILLIDINEERRGELAFCLQTNRYKVLSEAPDDGSAIDLVISCLSFVVPLSPGVPLMVMADTVVEAQIASPFANCHITFRTDRSLLLESIKTLTARKRGPQKGTPMPPACIGRVVAA
jgi:hypothetical protein